MFKIKSKNPYRNLYKNLLKIVDEKTDEKCFSKLTKLYLKLHSELISYKFLTHPSYKNNHSENDLSAEVNAKNPWHLLIGDILNITVVEARAKLKLALFYLHKHINREDWFP